MADEPKKRRVARLTVRRWQLVAKENSVAQKMALAQFKLSDLGAAGGVGLRAVYLCGPPGIGKTHSIVAQEAAWRARGIEPLRFRPSNVRELLGYFEAAAGRSPLIMEEADVIFRSKPMFEVLKQATDPLTPDILYKMAKIGKETVPVPINLNVPIIVSTNMDLMGDAGWREELLADRDALFNRSAPVSIARDTVALWEWSVYLALTSHLTKAVTVRNPNGGRPIEQSNPLPVQAAAIDWFTDHVNQLSVISPRTLKQVAQIMGRAHLGDMPQLVCEQELNALLGGTNTDPIPIPAKADWADLLKSMPKIDSTTRMRAA